MNELSRLLELELSKEIIDKIYLEKCIDYDGIDDISINSYILLKNATDTKHTALCKKIADNSLQLIDPNKHLSFNGVNPKDVKQVCFLDSLASEEIKISVCLGAAGTGKTTLALSYALDQLFNHEKKIYMCKSTALIGRGRAFGPVPGDVRDKYAPFISSYEMVLKSILGDKSTAYTSILEEKNSLEYLPLEYVRGCTFENCTFILDEIQNLTWHELKSTASRIGQNSKLILLGDLEQIDTNQSNRDTGIYKMIASNIFKKSEITSCMQLTQQYRGPVPLLISNIDKELNNK